jgi:hypothetical protein
VRLKLGANAEAGLSLARYNCTGLAEAFFCPSILSLFSLMVGDVLVHLCTDLFATRDFPPKAPEVCKQYKPTFREHTSDKWARLCFLCNTGSDLLLKYPPAFDLNPRKTQIFYLLPTYLI